ncbi:hypothetical protein A3Q56_02281 [Intoshia linei]|uniref:Uncharacterized protein n=1 Tax=Intoshia linei TaxID=1819745 RepID=A0A177B8C2_9BILA|nr:hypothetical protein A3Q56_02281 [Intoshia linei]
MYIQRCLAPPMYRKYDMFYRYLLEEVTEIDTNNSVNLWKPTKQRGIMKKKNTKLKKKKKVTFQ